MTPATAASAAPIANVATMTEFAFTPIRLAMRGFSAVARIARPSFVFSTSRTRPPIIAAATIRIMICVGVISAPQTSIGLFGSSGGNTL